MEENIGHAMDSGEIGILYQPVLDLETGRIDSVEAVLRWDNVELGVVPADVFMPVAEDHDLGPDLGCWMMERICSDLRSWHDAGVIDVKASFSLTANQVRTKAVIDALFQALMNYRLPSDCLLLQLDSGHDREDQDLYEAVNRLRAAGVGLLLDNFSAEQTTINSLHDHHYDAVRLNCTLKPGQHGDRGHEDLSVILDVMSALGLRTVMRDVDETGCVGLLRSLGCNAIQGRSFSAAISSGSMLAMLRRNYGVGQPASSHLKLVSSNTD